MQVRSSAVQLGRMDPKVQRGDVETLLNVRVILSLGAVALFAMTGWLNRVRVQQGDLRLWDGLGWWYESTAGATFALALWVSPPWLVAGLAGGLAQLAVASGLRGWIRRQLPSQVQ